MIYVYFMCMGILPVRMFCALSACQMLAEVRRECWILWAWSYRWLGAAMCGWEFNPGPLEKQPVLLTTKPDCSPFQYGRHQQGQNQYKKYTLQRRIYYIGLNSGGWVNNGQLPTGQAQNTPEVAVWSLSTGSFGIPNLLMKARMKTLGFQVSKEGWLPKQQDGYIPSKPWSKQAKQSLFISGRGQKVLPSRDGAVSVSSPSSLVNPSSWRSSSTITDLRIS